MSARVDVWLWAVRAFPTRSASTAACRAGRVEVDGRPAKPAAPVEVGDRVLVRLHGHERDLEVVQVISKRVGAPVAAQCYVDHAAPRPPRDDALPERDRGTGRPTKRDRRQLDAWRSGRR